jgi:hypothetical protein
MDSGSGRQEIDLFHLSLRPKPVLDPIGEAAIQYKQRIRAKCGIGDMGHSPYLDAHHRPCIVIPAPNNNERGTSDIYYLEMSRDPE